MKVIILGAGQVGTTIAENLSEDHDITVVDLDADCLLQLQGRLDIRTIVGSATYPKVLEDAGAQDADMLVAVTDDDASNIVACQVAFSLFKTPNKVARVRARELSSYEELFKPGNIAIDTIINPAHLVTQRLKQQIDHPGTQMLLNFAENKLQMASIRAIPPHPLIGRRLLELVQDTVDHQVVFTGILRSGRVIMPREETIIEPHDELFYCMPTEHTNAVTSLLTGRETKYRRIMVAGGGNIGVALAQSLELDYKVKLLERDPKQAEHAAEALKDTVVLVGDVSDTDLLQSENIDEADLFVSVTNDDEANIMSAILAKRLGAKNTIALVNRQTYAHYLIERSPDIDLAISPQRITGGKILTYLRKGDIVNLYPMPRSSAEAIEVIAHGDSKVSKLIGRPLHKVRLPEQTRVCAVYREQQVIMADDDLTIEEGDHVVMFIGNKAVIPEIEKLFQVAPTFL